MNVLLPRNCLETYLGNNLLAGQCSIGLSCVVAITVLVLFMIDGYFWFFSGYYIFQFKGWVFLGISLVCMQQWPVQKHFNSPLVVSEKFLIYGKVILLIGFDGCVMKGCVLIKLHQYRLHWKRLYK